MQERGRLIELRTCDGKPILSFYLVDREIGLDDKGKKPEAPSPQHHQLRNEGANGDGGGRKKTRADKPPQSSQAAQAPTGQQQSMMTDAQKRFLFRILADRGIEGDQALAHLKKLFGVEVLKDVSKLEASRGIEKLLEQSQAKATEKGGNRSHADHQPPF
jgi:hypothetical protein